MSNRRHPFINNYIYHIFDKTIDGKRIFSDKKICETFLEVIRYYRSNESYLRYSKYRELPEELKLGKAQRFQFNGSDCGPISLYTAVLRYAAKPGNEQEKQKLVEQFANDFGVIILTRKELLGHQPTTPEPSKPPEQAKPLPIQIDSAERLVETLETHPEDQPLAFSVTQEALPKVLPDLLIQAITTSLKSFQN